MSEIVVVSTTDTQEAVNAAAGITAESTATAKTDQPSNVVESTEVAQKTETEEAAGKTTEQSEAAKEGEGKATAEKKEEKNQPPKDGKQKRIDRLTARNYSLQKDNSELRERVERIEQQLTGGKKTEAAKVTEKPVVEDLKPTREKFASDAEFNGALQKWEVRNTVKEELSKEKEAAVQQEAEAQQREIWDGYLQQVEDARSRFEDFDEVVGRDDVAIPQAAQLAIVEMPNGADIAYHLGNNLELCEKLMKMTPTRAVAEIGRISDKLIAQSGKPKEEQGGSEKTTVQRQTPTSAAPPPIKPVAGASTKTSVPLDELPYNEYRAKRDEQERQRFRR